MPDVPKDVAASAQALSIPAPRTAAADKEYELVRLAQSGQDTRRFSNR